MRQPPVRIAHAYGNRRSTLREALAAPVDMVEADIWFRAGEVWVRHERRLGLIPILLDRRLKGARHIGPWALMLGPRFYLRLDTRPMPLSELLERTRGRRRLLLDVKGGYSPRDEAAFARRIVRLVRQHGRLGEATICGKNWSVLERVRAAEPELEVRYSIEEPRQWERFQRTVREDRQRGICISRRLLDRQRAGWLEEQGIGVYCWTVDDREEAERLLAAGVEGIISNDLELLASLGPPPA